MAELGWILALPALLLVVGLLFVAQYRLAVKERKWPLLVIPACLLALFLGFAVAVTAAGNQYEVRALLGTEDGHGNVLKMTVQMPKEGDTITQFSDLMVYDQEGALLDVIHLYYDNNQPELGQHAAYDPYIREMLNGMQLDGSSWEEEIVANGVTFMGLTIVGNPVKLLAFAFGIPFLIILFAGILPRILNRKKIRMRALARMDIQSLEDRT